MGGSSVSRNEIYTQFQSWMESVMNTGDLLQQRIELSSALFELFEVAVTLEERVGLDGANGQGVEGYDALNHRSSQLSSNGGGADRRPTLNGINRKASIIPSDERRSTLTHGMSFHATASGAGLHLVRLVGINQLQNGIQPEVVPPFREKDPPPTQSIKGDEPPGCENGSPGRAPPVRRSTLGHSLATTPAAPLVELFPVTHPQPPQYSSFDQLQPHASSTGSGQPYEIDPNLSFRDSQLKLSTEVEFKELPLPSNHTPAVLHMSRKPSSSNGSTTILSFPHSPHELAVLEGVAESNPHSSLEEGENPLGRQAPRNSSLLHQRSSGDGSCSTAVSTPLLTGLTRNSLSVLSIEDSTPNDHQGPEPTSELRVMEGTTETRSEDGATVICSFEVVAELGRGSFGTVLLVVDAEGETFAIKTLHRGTKVQRQGAEMDKLVPDPLRRRQSAVVSAFKQIQPQPSFEDAVEREIAVMKRLNHPNVVKLHAVIEDPEEGQTHLVMQYVENGPVAVPKADGSCTPLPLGLALHYMAQVAKGLRYLHRCGIIHRDIKPENILIGKGNTALVSDFGVSSIVTESDFPRSRAGTFAYMSPELLSNADAVNEYGVEGDVWAFGVTLYTLVFGELPFRASTGPMLARSIMMDNPSFPQALPLPIISQRCHSSSASSFRNPDTSSPPDRGSQVQQGHPGNGNGCEEPGDSSSVVVLSKLSHASNIAAPEGGWLTPSQSTLEPSHTAQQPSLFLRSSSPVEGSEDEVIVLRQLKILITQLLEKDPVRRMTLEEFSRNPLVRRFRKDPNAIPEFKKIPHPPSAGSSRSTTSRGRRATEGLESCAASDSSDASVSRHSARDVMARVIASRSSLGQGAVDYTTTGDQDRESDLDSSSSCLGVSPETIPLTEEELSAAVMQVPVEFSRKQFRGPPYAQ